LKIDNLKSRFQIIRGVIFSYKCLIIWDYLRLFEIIWDHLMIIWWLFENHLFEITFSIIWRCYYLTYLWLFVIIWWLFDDYSWLFELPNRDVRPYSGVFDYLVIIWDYCSYLITNNYQIMVMLFDDYSMVISMPIIPIIQITKSKCEYLVPFWQIIFASQQLLFDDYSWLFDDYLKLIIWSLS